MTEKERLDAFEKMLEWVKNQYAETQEKLMSLKKEGREKSATYRQMCARKIEMKQLLRLYMQYGLTDDKKE